MKQQAIYLFGEVLFDCFPEQEPVLGGAPLNVAWHLQGFGYSPYLVTSVGDDDLGKKLQHKMSEWGLAQDYVQINQQLPTGTVAVELIDGEPHYDIVGPVAWDDIDEQQVPEPEGGFFYHGSLACRNSTSKRALDRLLTHSRDDRIIDVNLRPPHWSKEEVLASLHCGLLVKLSLDELYTLSPLDEGEWQEQALALKQSLDIVNLLVTRGAQGASLFDGEDQRFDTAEDFQTLDNANCPVGAGDAFTSVVIMGVINQWDWSNTLERAHQFAGYIVTQPGAVVEDITIYQDFINFWHL